MRRSFISDTPIYQNYEDNGGLFSDDFIDGDGQGYSNFFAGNAPIAPPLIAPPPPPPVYTPAPVYTPPAYTPPAPPPAPEYDLMQQGVNEDGTPTLIQVPKGAAGNAVYTPPPPTPEYIPPQLESGNEWMQNGFNVDDTPAYIQVPKGAAGNAVYQPEPVYTPPPQIGGFVEPFAPMNPNIGIADETGFFMEPSVVTPAPTPPPAPVAVAPQAAPAQAPAPEPVQPTPQPVASTPQPAPATPAPATPAPTPTPATPAPVAPAPTPTTTASPTMATTSNIDPTIQPYLSYGLQEAQKLYQGGGPQYYGGQTYVSPSQQTQTGLQALEQRASRGSPLTGAAQSQLQGTIQGNYLSGNPFFQGAFNPAAQAAESKFKETLGSIGSAASKAGRYGSGAMSTMQQGASGQFAKTLADTAGGLAYQNYEAERGRQQAATMAAPQMAQTDYADIQNMLKAGQMREGYTGAQQQADIDRFNFQQTQPQQNLANFLSGVYGNPLGRAQQSASYPQASKFQNLLGTASLLGGIEKDTGWLSKGWNALTGGG